MKIVRLESVGLQPRPGRVLTVDQDNFAKALARASAKQDSWEGSIQWVLAETVEEGAAKIAPQLAQHYRGRLQQLGLRADDLLFKVTLATVKDGLFWPGERCYCSEQFTAGCEVTA